MTEKEKKKKNWGTGQLILAAVILLVAVVGITSALLWQINEFSLHLNMIGAEELSIDYGQTYEEPGAEAVFQGSLFMKEPTSIQVTTHGQVDASKLGTYHIDYHAERIVSSIFGDVTVTGHARRTVHVVDTVPPEITLTADPEVFTIPGETYQEEGFTASDNYDGDITDRVVRTESEETIIYEVADTSGNTVRVERAIVYHDPTPPILELKGKAEMTLTQGDSYEEPGFTATDNCDGDITDRVTVTGTVDIAKPGTYTLEYTVADSYENTAAVQRTVKVVKKEAEEPKPTEPKPTEPKPTEPNPTEPEEKPVEPANPTGGVIYLTFDDGPGRHTARLLDILAKHNVKATFFVVNTGYISLVSRMASEGHTVAMHTATHEFKEVYASEEAYFKDLETIQSAINKHAGITPMLLRFPGGSSNTISRFNPGIMTRLTQLVEEKGYTYFDWNVDSRDAGGASTSTEVYNNVVSAVAKRSSSVVLMHDIKGYTVDAIEDIILWGKANGYTFQPLTASSPTCHHGVNN